MIKAYYKSRNTGRRKTEHRRSSGTLAEQRNTGGTIGIPRNVGIGEHQWNNKTTKQQEMIPLQNDDILNR